jgi:DNA-directed RNA polymerase specialized sigma24 family protein
MPSNKDSILTQESFDALLTWLDPNRERAGQRYEEIRRRLIKIFTCRGCLEPEALADETIDRVVRRLKEIEGTYVGDHALYFYGVANKVHLEYLRKKPALSPPSPADDPDETEQEYECLERCIGRLPPGNRELVLEYYQEEKGAKIDHRKHLAERLGIALNALRIRAHRIRTALQECMQDCLGQNAAG